MEPIPVSMRDELQSWNSGSGIDLETWIECSGSFTLAVGYAAIFCPEFVEFEDYILRCRDITPHVIQAIRGFESRNGTTPRSVEWVLNHLHIADIHHNGCSDLSADKLIFIGNMLKKIYEARLAFLFPQKPCIVEFYTPDDQNNLDDYQLSFWQTKHA
jgi:hypothetical protein